MLSARRLLSVSDVKKQQLRSVSLLLESNAENVLENCLQSSSKARSFVLSDNWVRRFTHNNDFLIGHHHNPRQLWEPDANVDEALCIENTAKIHLRTMYLSATAYIFNKNSATFQVLDFELVGQSRLVFGVQLYLTVRICIGVKRAVISKNG